MWKSEIKQQQLSIIFRPCKLFRLMKLYSTHSNCWQAYAVYTNRAIRRQTNSRSVKSRTIV